MMCSQFLQDLPLKSTRKNDVRKLFDEGILIQYLMVETYSIQQQNLYTMYTQKEGVAAGYWDKIKAQSWEDI